MKQDNKKENISFSIPYNTEDHHNIYIIVDCAHFDHKFYREIRKNKALTAKSLFTDTPDEESAMASPVLIAIDPDKDQSFIDEINQIEQEKPAVLWIKTQQNMHQLFAFLQSILYGELSNNEKVIFRYYDPRCTKGILSVLKSDQEVASQLFKISSMAYKHNGQYQYIDEF